MIPVVSVGTVTDVARRSTGMVIRRYSCSTLSDNANGKQHSDEDDTFFIFIFYAVFIKMITLSLF